MLPVYEEVDAIAVVPILLLSLLYNPSTGGSAPFLMAPDFRRHSLHLLCPFSLPSTHPFPSALSAFSALHSPLPFCLHSPLHSPDFRRCSLHLPCTLPFTRPLPAPPFLPTHRWIRTLPNGTRFQEVDENAVLYEEVIASEEASESEPKIGQSSRSAANVNRVVGMKGGKGKVGEAGAK